jgi:hypothetical protein
MTLDEAGKRAQGLAEAMAAPGRTRSRLYREKDAAQRQRWSGYGCQAEEADESGCVSTVGGPNCLRTTRPGHGHGTLRKDRRKLVEARMPRARRCTAHSPETSARQKNTRWRAFRQSRSSRRRNGVDDRRGRVRVRWAGIAGTWTGPRARPRAKEEPEAQPWMGPREV